MIPQPLQRAHQAARRQWSSACSRLTTVSALFLLLGTFVLLACVGFLGFLWFAPESNRVWHSIVVSGWLIRSVTVTSVVIRAVVGSQTILCTSILASMLLEYAEAPIAQSAAISIMRFQAEGPWSLLEAAIHKPRTWRGFGVLALLLMLVTNSLASQFTSTALLSDVQQSWVPVRNEEPSMAYGVANRNGKGLLRGLPDYFENRPAFPTFAELWTEDANYSSTDSRQSTGSTLRAFFPIQDEDERSIIRSYEGLAPVFDTTVVCEAPSFLDVRLAYQQDEVGDSLVLLSGHIDQGTGIDGDAESGISQTVSFNCTVPVDNYDSDFLAKSDDHAFDQINICMLNSTSGGFPSSLPAPKTGSWDGDFWMAQLPTRQTYLVLRSEAAAQPKSPADGWFMYPYNSARTAQPYTIANNTEGVHGTRFAVSTSNASRAGAWTRLHTSASAYPLAATLCHSSMVGRVAAVTARRSRANVSEPHPVFDQRTGRYGTAAVLEQLGITPRGGSSSSSSSSNSSAEAGPPTLDLTVVDDQTTPPAELATLAYLTEFATYKTPDAGIRYSPGLLTSGNSQGSEYDCYVDRLYGAVVRDVLAATASSSSASSPRHHAVGGNAAVAVQSLVSLWAAQAYYDLAPYFDLAAPAALTRDVALHRPTRASWLAVVVALLALHLAVVAATVLVFLGTGTDIGIDTGTGTGTGGRPHRRRPPAVRSAWAAVACVRGDEVDALLLDASSSSSSSGAPSSLVIANDRDVRARLRDGPWQYRCGDLAGVDPETGRLRFFDRCLDAGIGAGTGEKPKATREDSFATTLVEEEGSLRTESGRATARGRTPLAKMEKLVKTGFFMLLEMARAGGA
ncbi:hypothetical protein GGR56DRAFT_680779 [Xylariaceae sp. FL0804]|nr:hypothetical protein GGR56DRAFT_680779 [Xylariaceae sp. FL0804]